MNYNLMELPTRTRGLAGQPEPTPQLAPMPQAPTSPTASTTSLGPGAGILPGDTPTLPFPSSGGRQRPGPTGAAPSGPFNKNAFLSLVQGKPFSQQTLLDIEPLLQQYGSKLTPANAIGERTKIWDPGLNDWVRVFGAEGDWQWIPQGWGAAGQQAGGGSGGVFNDPATQEWETLLRTLVDRLQQPQQTYTPAQRELMQTQAIEPLERQRQAQRQQTVERYAGMGHARSSGQLEQALQDVDRQFNQLRTQQQSGFALNQIGREDQLFNSNEQRALAGLNLFSQIPQYADSRLRLANSLLMPANPYQTLGLRNQVNQQGIQNQQWQQGQDQQFWQWLGTLLSGMF